VQGVTRAKDRRKRLSKVKDMERIEEKSVTEKETPFFEVTGCECLITGETLSYSVVDACGCLYEVVAGCEWCSWHLFEEGVGRLWVPCGRSDCSAGREGVDGVRQQQVKGKRETVSDIYVKRRLGVFFDGRKGVRPEPTGVAESDGKREGGGDPEAGESA
jgi:hypothetical protein